MRYLIPFAFVGLLFSVSACKKKTCKDFRTGKFLAPDEQINDISITRTDSTQIEWSEKRGFKDEYSITWVNDCEYFLVLKASNNPDKNLLNNRDTLRVSITAIEGDVYQYTAFLKDKKFVGDLKQVSENIN